MKSPDEFHHNSSTFYLRSTAFLLIASILHLIGEIIYRLNEQFAASVLLELSFILFALGFLLLPLTFGSWIRTIDVVASVCAFVGSIAGAAMQVLFRSTEVLAAAGNTQALVTLQNSRALHFSTLVPGILFPIGIIALAIALRSSKHLSLGTTLMLVLGAILFPLGHAADVTLARFASDIVITLACMLVAVDRSRHKML
jgi:hypothetical protein